MKHKLLICLATLLMLTSVSAASADVNVSFYTTTPTIEVGEIATVDIMATFDDPVMAWGLDLTTDGPGSVSLLSTLIGGDWDAADSLDEDDLAGLRFETGIAGNVLLATLTFQGVTEGMVPLGLSAGPEEDEGFLLEAGGLATGVTFTPTCLTVIPEPASLALFGLAVLALRRR